MKERLGTLVPAEESSRFIVRDLVTPGDVIVLVVPIDSAAPKGRLILPQQQTIRDLLDAGTTAIVVKETELKSTLDSLGKKPALVILSPFFLQDIRGIWKPSSTAQEHWTRWKTEIRS